MNHSAARWNQVVAWLLAAVLVLMAGCASKPESPSVQATDAVRHYVAALAAGDGITVDRMTLAASKESLGMPYAAGHGSLLKQVQSRAFADHDPSMVVIDSVEPVSFAKDAAGVTLTASNGDEFFATTIQATWKGDPPTALTIDVSGVLRSDGSMRITDISHGE